MSATVGQKGQIVIEKAIRDALGIEPGYIVVQRLINGHVELTFYPPEHKRSLFGALKGKVKLPKEELEWAEIRQRAWESASVRDWIDQEITATEEAQGE